MLPELGSLREAALAVHTLNDEDRLRLLDCLDTAERQRLLPLLDELRTLGIPRSFDVRGVLDSAAQPVHSGDVAEDIDYLQSQPEDRIAALLCQQSPATATLFLEAHRWRWKQTIKTALPLSAVALRTTPAEITGKVRASLISAAAARCRALQAAEGAAEDGSDILKRRTGLFGALRAWNR